MPQAQFFNASSIMPISHAVRAGDLVITATLGPHFFRAEDVTYDGEGRVIDDGSGKGHLGIAEQTRATMENVRVALESAGCTLADIVDMTVWLSSPRDFADFNAVYAEYFPASKTDADGPRHDLHVRLPDRDEGARLQAARCGLIGTGIPTDDIHE